VPKQADDGAGRASRVVLIGMMGSGKTTVGRLVAERLGSGFADTDEEVESFAGISVPEMFERDGEAAFRRAETEALETLLARSGSRVVAVGGGAVLSEANREAIRRQATVIWLRATVGTLTDRVGSGEGRPLLVSRTEAGSGRQWARLEELNDERCPLYETMADLVVDTDGLSAEEVADAVVSAAGLS
jgi:shikimate kinase